MEPVALSFSAAVVMGLIYGAGPCNIACLPYLGPVFLARSGGIRQAWRTILPFSLGRLSAYAVLGAMAATAGRAVTVQLENGTGTIVLGIASVTVGLVILWRSVRKSEGSPASCSGHRSPEGEAKITLHRKPADAPLMPMGLFGMGTAMALNPCVPLGTVALAAAVTADPMAGLMLGLGFGLGAVAIPAVLFSLVVAHIGAEVRERLSGWKGGLERAAGAMLIGMGALSISGLFHP
ncbi:sulfite exporter TauE/SafE family protein [Thiohalomonas denitrificans]|uniref:Cytochrome c biogenesis protein CcdA n=1 Tax=Thiohalomonas denitrificans TaxID=415747 RepID=A0A1G5PI84_9GAMM|nr:sulfite exporter TauE/SafE family protein [Thiohalomonas denitrificans]SCZ49098.1 Cytochrome c biogenesis protein CcdA [Thiohalomonas denitrificans]